LLHNWSEYTLSARNSQATGLDKIEVKRQTLSKFLWNHFQTVSVLGLCCLRAPSKIVPMVIELPSFKFWVSIVCQAACVWLASSHLYLQIFTFCSYNWYESCLGTAGCCQVLLATTGSTWIAVLVEQRCLGPCSMKLNASLRWLISAVLLSILV
jgi:hypothetical protein